MPRIMPLFRVAALALLFTLFAAGYPSIALGQPYYYFRESLGTKATYVYKYDTTVAPCTNHYFYTTNLTGNADTVMYLIENGTEVKYNDDYTGLGLGSRIQYGIPCGGANVTLTVYVMAKSNATGGDGGGQCGQPGAKCFEFFHNIWSQGVHRLGGYIAASGTMDTVANDTVETILINNGARATRLFRFRHDGTHYRFYGVDQSSGVGLASKYWGTAYGNERWVIATPDEDTQEGPVRLARNDRNTLDSDVDGLGNGLEQEACTCSTSGYYTGCGGYSCALVNNVQDTDGDGLQDNWELIGVDHESTPQLLPLWGSSPRHKDLFVEVDTDLPPLAVLSEQQANFVAQRFAQLSTVTNFDGVTGIAAHLDIGAACTMETGDVDGITSICGDFGGFNYGQTPCPEESDPVQCCKNHYAASVWPVRQGKFHWVWRSPANPGASPRAGLSLCSWVGSHEGDDGAAQVTHELGHQLGLLHWGLPSAGRVNRKPNYPSLMNYTYDYEFGGSDASDIQFSSGTFASQPLDPRNLNETVNFGGTGSLTFLTNDQLYDYSTDPLSPRHVDWNRDGLFDPSVQAHVVGEPNDKAAGGADSPMYIGEENLPSVATNAAIGSAYYAGETFVVAKLSPPLNRLRYSQSSSVAGGWSPWADIPNSPTMLSDSGPAVVNANLTGNELLYIFAVDSTGALRYAGMNSSIVLTLPWQTVSPPPGASIREVNVTRTSTRIYVVAADLTQGAGIIGTTWLGWVDVNGWSGWTMVQVSGQRVRSTDNLIVVTPGLAAGPDGRIYMTVVASPNMTDRYPDLDMYEYSPATQTWVRTAQEWLDEITDCMPQGRIATVFRAHRSGSGTPLSSGTGALWTWYHCVKQGSGVDRTRYRWTWDTFNASTQTFNHGRWHQADPGSSGACFADDGTYSGVGGFALVDHPTSLSAYITNTGDGVSCGNSVYHLPHADGTTTPSVLLNDVDDGAVMASNLCASAHWLEPCKCGNFSSTCAPPDYPPEPWVDCVPEEDDASH